jgi:hypothetical protein
VLGDLITPKGSAAHHIGHQRVVLGELVQLVVSVQVRTAIADVDDTQLRTQVEGHRHRRPHAAQFRVLRGFFEDAGIGVANRRLELRENSVLFLPVRSEKPSERIERELLDRRDGESARPYRRLLERGVRAPLQPAALVPANWSARPASLW